MRLQPGSVAVVDDDARLVGVMDPGGRLAKEDAGRGWAIPEDTCVPAALRLMALRHWRTAPVVAPSGTVVGVVQDVDALRALTARAAL